MDGLKRVLAASAHGPRERLAQGVQEALWRAALGLQLPRFFHTEASPFYEHPKGTAYTHDPLLVCGRAFRPGETVYQCADCGYDETCVLCGSCYNRLDHAGHRVAAYRSKGDSGFCDCGDAGAFAKSLRCRCLLQLAQLDAEVQHGITQTLEAALDFVLDVTQYSLRTLPYVHLAASAHLSHISALPSDVYGSDPNLDTWYLVLYNDEHHDYREAEKGIRDASGCSALEAKRLAAEINARGRAVIRSGPSYELLLRLQTAAEADGLVAAVMTSRDYWREEAAGAVCSWLAALVGCEDAYRDFARSALAEALLRPGFAYAKPLYGEFFRGPRVAQRCFENGIWHDGHFPNLGLSKLRPAVLSRDLARPVGEVLRPAVEEPPRGLRLQFLLMHEVRLVAHARRSLKTAVMPVLTATLLLKRRFAEQYLEIYPSYFTASALADREELLSMRGDVSVQLFTCPHTNAHVLPHLGKIVGPLCALIEEHAAFENAHTGLVNVREIVTDVRSKRLKLCIDKAIEDGIADVTRIVSKNSSNVFAHLVRHDTLVFVLLLLKYFEGAYMVSRKYGDHVERELQYEYIQFIRKHLPVLNIVAFATDSSAGEPRGAAEAALLVYQFLQGKRMAMQLPGVARFSVSRDMVAFVNPVLSLFSRLCFACSWDEVHRMHSRSETPFMRVSDYALRSIVWAAQVKIGHWIRNGQVVLRQATLYLSSSISAVTFRRDLHLNRLAALLDDPTTTLRNFLDRWELSEWFQGAVDHRSTVYDDRFGFVCEQFVKFLYCLVTERVVNSDEPACAAAYRVRQRTMYALCEWPLPYSQLALETEAPADQLEGVLSDLCVYSPPKTLSGVGTYRLKDEFFECIDPYSVHLETAQFHAVSEYVALNLERIRGTKDVVLEPVFDPCANVHIAQHIADICKTTEFFKLVYKLLQVALDNKDDTYLLQLLHLVHAVIRDDASIHGAHYSNEAFHVIPVGDLLLSIVECDMLAAITRKARFLLDYLLQRDQQVYEGLVDCFGELHVANYVSRGAGAGETQEEKRKRVAAAKRDKVMRKLAKQRKRFLSQNRDSSAEETHESLRRCVACGEPERDEFFGLFFDLFPSAANWTVPKDTAWFERAFSNHTSSFPGFPHKRHEHEDDLTGFACGHGMHFRCYLLYVDHATVVSCPLCHEVHGMFLPTFPSGPLLMADAFSSPPEDPTEPHPVQALLRWLQQATERPDTILNSSELEVFESHFFRFLGEDHYSGAVRKLEHVIANVVRTHEAACRLDADSAAFLDMPHATMAMLKALVQCRVVAYANRTDPLLGSKGEATPSLEQPPLALDRVLWLFFEEGDKFHTALQLTYCRVLHTTVFALVTLYAPQVNQFSATVRLSPENTAALRALFSAADADKVRNWDAVYECALRVVLLFLRQCALFWHVMASNGANEPAERTLQLAAAIRHGPNSLDPYLACFGLLDPMDLLRNAANLPLELKAVARLTPLAFTVVPYPGTIRLCDLPEDHSVAVEEAALHPEDECLCLLCGQYAMVTHRAREHACENTLFLSAKENILHVLTPFSPDFLRIPGPYLTRHGEVVGPHIGGPATLSEMRYNEINKLWLTRRIIGLATRSSLW